MNAITSYILSKKFTEETASEFGALKGASAQIQSIVPITGGNRITFVWENTAGETRTETLDVIDGKTPECTVIEIEGGHKVTFTIDGQEYVFNVMDGVKGDKGDKGDTGEGIPTGGATGQVLVKKSSTDYDTEWGTPAGGGDMLKSVYDTDNDGKVDSAENADTVDGHTVAKDVPADAVFTDTVYDDTEIKGEIADKVDKENGKGLSTNDYTNADKAIVDGVTSALSDKVDKVTGKGLSANDFTDALKDKLDDIEPNAEVNVQADWSETDTTDDAYIANKPTLGTASAKDSTDRVSPNNTALVESQSVYSAINTALSSIYTPRGDITCAELTSELLISDNVGNIYEVSDSGTTTALFLQGAGVPISAGTNVGIISAGQGRILFNLMANAFDLTSYQKIDLAQAVEGETTVEDALGALSTKKASKVSSATNGNFAGLDASGNLTDSGKKADDFATAEGLADEAKTRAKLGAHNFVALNKSTYKPQYAANLSSVTNQTEDSVTVTSIAADYAGLRLYNKMAPGEYIVSYDFESDDTNYVPAVSLYYTDSGMIPNGGNILKNTQRKITVLDSYDYVEIRLFITKASDAVIRTGTFKNLMFRLATDTDSTYQPYAKTNLELTRDKTEQSDFKNEVDARVNLGAHNLFFNKALTQVDVSSGLTFTVNNDKSVTVSATSEVYPYTLPEAALFMLNTDSFAELEDGKDYIVAGCPYGGSLSSYFLHFYKVGTIDTIDAGTGSRIFTKTAEMTNVNMRIEVKKDCVLNEALTFKPMIRLATDADDTYQPYSKTNQQLTEDKAEQAEVNDMVNVLGAKNLIPYPYQNSTTTTASGITFTDNGGGSIKINGSTTNSRADFFMRWIDEPGNADLLKELKNKGTLRLSMGTTSNAFDIIVDWYDSTKTYISGNRLNGAEYIDFNVPSTASYMAITLRVFPNSTVDNVTIYPMLRLASITDDTYEPYAKTNQQLTEDSVDWESNSVLGAKNFLTNKGTATTQGVEFAVDSNGVFTVTRKSAGSSHAYYSNGRFTLKPGTYIFSNGYNSLPSGIQATYLYNHTDGVYFINCNNGPKTFTITEEKELAFNIEVQTTQSPSGVKIYPMIRLASDNDATYQPYAKTNRELTEAVDGMMMKVGRYTKTVKGTNTTYGALIDQICADMKTMIDGFADTNTKVIPMSITIDGLVTVFVRPDQYKKGDNFNIVAYCTSCDGTTFNTFYLRGLSGSGNSTIYRQDVTASSQAINDFTSTSFTGDKNISLIYDRYQII